MKTMVITTILLAGGIALANHSFAQTGTFAQTHPRRAQVNSRLNNQNARIDRKVDNGRMSQAEAAKLHHEDHQVRHEERDMASQNHGHITRQEKSTLNHQENKISRQVHNH